MKTCTYVAAQTIISLASLLLSDKRLTAAFPQPILSTHGGGRLRGKVIMWNSSSQLSATQRQLSSSQFLSTYTFLEHCCRGNPLQQCSRKVTEPWLTEFILTGFLMIFFPLPELISVLIWHAKISQRQPSCLEVREPSLALSPLQAAALLEIPCS